MLSLTSEQLGNIVVLIVLAALYLPVIPAIYLVYRGRVVGLEGRGRVTRFLIALILGIAIPFHYLWIYIALRRPHQ